MRVLSLSSRRTLSLLRRVIAPFSVLATRGHAFYFQEVSSFDPVVSYGYDVTLLQNWILSDEEYTTFARVAAERTFVYDLSDPALLQLERVRATLSASRLVTVPNKYLARECRQIASRVVELPSCIDFPLFMYGRTVGKPTRPVIGCFGPHDWELVKEAIGLVKEQHPRVTFVGDRQAAKVLGNLVEPVELDIAHYPGYLHSCLFGLCPFDGDQGQETIWGLEYGILCKPIVAASGSQYRHVLPDAQYVVNPSRAESWVVAMETLLQDAVLRSHRGKLAYEIANSQRATRLAGEYLAAYRHALPHIQ